MKKFNIKLIFLLSVLFFFTIFLLKSLTYNYYPDYSTYYYAVSALQNNLNPYIQQQNMFAGYLYPPFSLLFFTLFHIPSFYLSQKIFTLISLCCFFLSIYILFRICKIKPFSSIGILILILLFNYFPAKFTLGMGQINNVILLLISLFLYYYHKQQKICAGIALGIAISLKIFPVLLLLYLLIRKQWNILATTIGVIIILLFISFIFIDHSFFFYYFTTAAKETLTSWPHDYYNQSLTGFLGRTVPNETLGQMIKIPLMLLLLGIAIISFYKIPRNKYTDLLFINNLIIVNILCNTIAWQHHFVWAIIPLLTTFSYIRNAKHNKKYEAILLLSFLLMAINLKTPSAFPSIVQSHVFYGTIVLYILQIYLVRINSTVYKLNT